MNELFLVGLLFLAIIGSAFASLPASCNKAYLMDDITSLPYSINGSSGISFSSLRNYSSCGYFTFTEPVSITFKFTPKYSDTWSISLFNSDGTLLSQKSGSSTFSINGKSNKNKAYFVIEGKDLSANTIKLSNGYSFSFDIIKDNSTPSGTNCTAGYKCTTNSNGLAYLMWQEKNCDWQKQDTVYCEFGCSNNRCNSETLPQNCSAKWVCVDDMKKGYQNTDCSITQITGCDNGCKNNACQSAPEPIPTPTPTPTPSCDPHWQCNDSTHESYVNSDCSRSNITYCALGCGTTNRCNSADPTITIMYQSPKVDAGYLASFMYSVSGNYEETGTEYGYRLDSASFNRKPETKNSNNKYLVVMAGGKGRDYIFIRAYATVQGKTIYSDIRRINVDRPLISDTVNNKVLEELGVIAKTDFAYKIDKIDLGKMGIDGVKFMTIGSCIDNGILDFWCVADLASTALFVISIVNPADAGIPDAIAVETKLGKLAKTTEVLKAIKTGEQLGNYIAKITIYYKDASPFVKTGLDLSGALDKGIIKIVNGEIKATSPYLFRQIIEKGDYSIIRLISSGNKVNLLEMLAEKGLDLSTVKFATSTANKTAPLSLVWLENGAANKSGWQFILTHARDFETKIGIRSVELQGAIRQTIENPTSVKIVGNTIEFYKNYTYWLRTRQVKVIVSNASGEVGKILNAVAI